MAINLKVNVDSTEAEKGLRKIGDAAEKSADKTEDSFKEAGEAGANAIATSTEHSNFALRGTGETASHVAATIGEALRRAGAGVGQTTGDVQQLGEALTEAGATGAKEMGQAADAVAEQGREVRQARGDVERLEKTYADVDRAAGRATDEVREMGETGEKSADQIEDGNDRAEKSVSRFKGAIDALNHAWDVAKDGAEMLGNAIDALAENGNPAALELQDSLSQVKTEFLLIAEDQRFQEVLTAASEFILEDLLPAIRAVSSELLSWRRASSDWLAGSIVAVGEWTGAYDKGTAAILEADLNRRNEMEANSAANVAARRRELQANKDLLDVNEELARIEKEKQRAGLSEAFSQIRTQEEIADIIEDAKESLQEQGISEERKLELLERIRQAEQRGLELSRESRSEFERHQEQVRRAEEEARRSAEAEAKRRAEAAKAEDERRKREAAAAEDKKRRDEERINREIRGEEERRRRWEEGRRRPVAPADNPGRGELPPRVKPRDIVKPAEPTPWLPVANMGAPVGGEAPGAREAQKVIGQVGDAFGQTEEAFKSVFSILNSLLKMSTEFRQFMAEATSRFKGMDAAASRMRSQRTAG